MAGVRTVLLILISFCWASASALPVTSFSGVSEVGVSQTELEFNGRLHFSWSTRVLEDRTEDRNEDIDLTIDSNLTTFWRSTRRIQSLSKSYHVDLCIDRVILFHRLIC